MAAEKETTQRLDWRSGEGYPPAEGTSMKRWAWEFLRRNSAYRNDWTRLQALEEYLSADEIKAGARGWVRCYRPNLMGERWGLLELVDPATEYSTFVVQFLRAPGVTTVGPGWEGFGSSQYLVKAEDGGIAWRSAALTDGLEIRRVQAAIVLHYDRPLKSQLRAIERHWASRRKRLLKEGMLAPRPAVRDRAGPEGLRVALRALDAK